MKLYTVVLVQLIVWSGFTLIEWLSKYDEPFFKALMFFVFLYIGINIGNYISKSARKTIVATFVSLCLYGSFHLTMSLVS